MSEVIITVKPTLSDISNPKFMSDLLADIGDLVADNLSDCAEKIGEKVLDYAKENASRGYSGLPYGNDAWAPRSPEVDKLYELSPFHIPNMPGLDTGARKLVTSLERHGFDNIFIVSGSKGENRVVTVGTGFHHAKLLEEGGMRRAFPNIGFTAEGKPTRWLMQAMIDGLISSEEVNRIQELWFQPTFMPPRPFLKPAMWHIRDVGIHTSICSRTLIRELQTDLSLDRVQHVRGDSGVVTE